MVWYFSVADLTFASSPSSGSVGIGLTIGSSVSHPTITNPTIITEHKNIKELFI